MIAAGVVINPASLLQEIENLVSRGIRVSKNLMVSTRAHVIFPWHFEEDRLMNESTSGEALGTTMRGIGPCYRDKVGRSYAIRLGDMYRESFAGRVEQIVAAKRRILTGLGCPENSFLLDAKKIHEQYRGYAERLRPYVGDTTAYLLDAVDANKKLLFEGAQAHCWTSITARSPSSPAATVPEWACRAVPACPAAT